MRIAIISPHSLPIPTVKGGAVEGLIEKIVVQNEKERKMDIELYSIADENIVETNYKYTKINYLERKKALKKIDDIITKIIRVIRHKDNIVSLDYIWKIYVIKKMRHWLRKESFDKIVIENAVFLFNIFNTSDLKEKYAGKVYIHVHNEIIKKPSYNIECVCRNCLSISDYLHDNIKKMLGDNLTIRTVYNGIDIERYNQILSAKEKKDVTEKYNIDSSKFTILFTGRITPEKGIMELLSAFNELADDNMQLIIVGKCYFGSDALSPFEKKITEMIKDNHSIITTGFINQDDIWKFYKLADAVVLPSMWEEPLGLTMIEAEASGTPLITTYSGGIPETVRSEYSILLNKDEKIVDNIKKSIIEIMENQEKWMINGEEASYYVREKFSMETFYNAFFDSLNKED